MVWIYDRAYHNAFCRRDKIYIGSTDHNLERNVTKKKNKKKRGKKKYQPVTSGKFWTDEAK